MEKKEILAKLEKYNQTHLLDFDGELTDEERQVLFSQIAEADFSIIEKLSQEEKTAEDKISPIEVLKKEEIEANFDYYKKIGIDALKNNKVALILLAGGQGSRLGFDKAKGMLNVGIDKQLFIFEIFINNLKKIADEAGNWIYMFIMVSPQNGDEVKSFFEENNYFGYNKDFILFFKQNTIASLDIDGKILMSSKHSLTLAPDGNGNFYAPFKANGFADILENLGVEWINIFSVDNVLQKIADPAFIGATIASKCNCGAKVVKKANPSERVGMLCLRNNRPSVIEYFELPKELENASDASGDLLYGFGVILNYLLSTEMLRKISTEPLPIHIAKKIIKHIDRNGKLIEPSEPNAYKFEYLLTDIVDIMGTCLPFEVVRDTDFAPIKNRSGVDSLDTARELLKLNGYEI